MLLHKPGREGLQRRRRLHDERRLHAAPNCDDGNVCTTDGCNPATGCTHTNNTNPCDDGNACTTGDTCSGGTCVGGAAPNCDDGNVCTTDGCNPATGCTHTNNTNPCNDGNPCTTGDACSGGTCVGGPAKNCDDGSKCTIDTCDPTVAGGCLHTGVDCDDHNLCTTDTCNPSTGCVNTDISSSCNDGIACTLDSCDPNTGCVNTDNCPDIDCKVPGSGTCNHTTGQCTYTNSPDGTSCQDTDGDSCTTPACVTGCCNQKASTNTANCPVTNCSIMYPFSSTNPRTNVSFNESEVLRTFSPEGGVLATPGLTIKLWYNDEHALFLGVNKVSVKTSSGTTTTNYIVSPLCATPASGCAVAPPQVGTSALDGDQAGTDTSSCTSFPDLCDRPLYPALFVTDTTGTGTCSGSPPNSPCTTDADCPSGQTCNNLSKAGDWQCEGTASCLSATTKVVTPIIPSAVFGTWKAGSKAVDKTVTPNTVTYTVGSDPSKNNWTLGAGSDPVPFHCSISTGTTCTCPTGVTSCTNLTKCPAIAGKAQTCIQPANEGYGAEARWSVDSLITNGTFQPAHSYRLEFMIHDGDQNKTGGDSGENCVNLRIPGTTTNNCQ
ncbi:MAG: hypothetical protein E6J71_28445 [Deltaproteobacteria bacterium]|nr:MAG: hypothetical protein E6J71_28445 [Deltaproteobacteria bacterium]